MSSTGADVLEHVLDMGNRVAAAAMGGAGIEELTALFSQMSGRSVVVLDTSLKLRSCATAAGGPAWDPHHRWTRRLLRVLPDQRRPLRLPVLPGDTPHGCLALPISVGAVVLGHLLILDPSTATAPDDIDLLIGSHIATLFALPLGHEHSSRTVDLRHHTMLTESLLYGEFLDADDAARKMAALGFAEPTPFVVGVLRPVVEGADEGGPDAAERLCALLSRAVDGAATVSREHDVIAIIPWTSPRLGVAGVVDRIATATSTVHPRGRRRGAARVTCGLSDVATSATEVPRLVRDAEAAVEIGVRIGRSGDVVRYGDLGVYRLLLKIPDLNELWRFAADVLGPVMTHDTDHRLDLVRTLATFLDNGRSPKRAAVALQVHANTVANRLQRIEQLTTLDLGNPDDVLTAHLAVKILDAQGMTAERRVGRFAGVIGRAEAKDVVPDTDLAACPVRRPTTDRNSSMQ